MKLFLAATLAGALAATAAHAQQPPWAWVKRQCAEAAEAEMHARTNCASCVGAWPSAAMCAVNAYSRGVIPPARTMACIEQIWAARFHARACAQCGDPIDDVFSCAQR